MKQETEVRYINWGIASRVGGIVFINKRLKDYPKLENALLSHERAHTSDFTMKDILLDINLKDLKGLKWEYYKFIISNPSSWVEYSPVKKYGDFVLFNLPLLLIWLFAGGLAWYIIAGLN